MWCNHHFFSVSSVISVVNKKRMGSEHEKHSGGKIFKFVFTHGFGSYGYDDFFGKRAGQSCRL